MTSLSTCPRQLEVFARNTVTEVVPPNTAQRAGAPPRHPRFGVPLGQHLRGTPFYFNSLLVRRFLRVLLILICIPGLALLIFINFFHRGTLNAKRRGISPSGEFIASALPFHSQRSADHPLNGTLRLFVGAPSGPLWQRQQTTLPVSISTRLGWIAGSDPETFQIWDWHGTRMVWQMEGREAVCVKGQEFLTSDPYGPTALPTK